MKALSEMNELVCYIVGAGVFEENIFYFPNKGLVIAADGGLTALQKAGVNPDYLIGDFDSLKEIPDNITIEEHNSEKDETDMMLAVNKGFDSGYNRFVLYGGLGGRLEHSIANIQLLNYISKNGGRGYLVQGRKVITVLFNDKINIQAEKEGFISVFSLSQISKGVTLTGLKYILNDQQLKNDYPIGVSNEFIGQAVSIEVKDGSLIIMWEMDNPEKKLFI